MKKIDTLEIYRKELKTIKQFAKLCYINYEILAEYINLSELELMDLYDATTGKQRKSHLESYEAKK